MWAGFVVSYVWSVYLRGCMLWCDVVGAGAGWGFVWFGECLNVGGGMVLGGVHGGWA